MLKSVLQTEKKNVSKRPPYISYYYSWCSDL